MIKQHRLPGCWVAAGPQLGAKRPGRSDAVRVFGFGRRLQRAFRPTADCSACSVLARIYSKGENIIRVRRAESVLADEQFFCGFDLVR